MKDYTKASVKISTSLAALNIGGLIRLVSAFAPFAHMQAAWCLRLTISGRAMAQL